MSNAIEIISRAMNADLNRLNTISQNLANTEKVGYKRQVASTTLFADPMMASDPLAVQSIDTMSSDMSQGALKKTGNSLDLAIDGDGFFVVHTDQGDRYTREAQLKVNSRGVLALENGMPVQGESGDVTVGVEPFIVHADGTIEQNGKNINKLSLVSFDKNGLGQYIGGGLYEGIAPQKVGVAKILQGYTEASNVNPTQEMVGLIELVRHYESMGKIFSGYDEVLESAITTLGQF